MKSKNVFELDPERLASTDEHGNRVYIHPESVKGVWKNRRRAFYWALMVLYLSLPWFNVNGKPALLIDLLRREFTFMGHTLHGVEPVLFFLLLASGIFIIGAVTSLLGRVWCGWACPQTVFIQGIFMQIDVLFEGSARLRRELDGAPWGWEKALRRSGKWLVFTLVSLHIAHTFIGYFVGPRELLKITLSLPAENWGLFLATMTVTSIFLLDFGWFREQFCIIACPYGRMQSVLMDENSLVISYDVKRGEPRRGSEGIGREGEGDCINCYNCVKVCPTGIDIRRGTQLECIACTQCIDACDDVMAKLKRPKGLIRYSSESESLGKGRKLITPRSLVYASISILFIALFWYFLRERQGLDMTFLRSKTPFQVTEEGRTVINHFTMKLCHQGKKIFRVELRIKDSVGLPVKVVTASHPLTVDVPEKRAVIFFKFHPSLLQGGSRPITVEAIDAVTAEVLTTKEVTLVGPTHELAR